ncbi:MAG: tripartite tricarboxylate transporter substrate binding protein [Burkholderiaceae bacterium]|nr:tripartite tricarboxylate transporter substrate binding protein [Burkholderiaceae bacterium]
MKNNTLVQKRVVSLALTVFSTFAAFVPHTGFAAYPERAIRIVVPFPAGGGSDLAARVIAEPLMARMGQSVIVDNRPGGLTVIGHQNVASAPPDGYTLLLCTEDISSINAAYNAPLPYDPIKGFTFIAGIAEATLVLLAGPESGIKNINDLISKSKANPGKLSFASLGSNSPHFLFFEAFKQSAGLDLIDVPYKGTNEAVAAVVGKQVDLTLIGAATAARFAQTRGLVALAATGNKRTPFAPTVATFGEFGYQDATLYSRFGLCGPAGMTQDVAKKLQKAVLEIVHTPTAEKTLATIGLTPWATTGDDFLASTKRSTDKWKSVIQRIATGRSTK